MKRVDRRELAVLGLLALAWCLVVAPVLHRLTHAHGHQHTHTTPVKQQGHGDGTFEHQSVTFTAAAAAPTLTLQLVALATQPALTPTPPDLAALRRVEQPGAP